MAEVISSIPAESEADSFLQIPDDGEFSSILNTMFSTEQQQEPSPLESVSSHHVVKQVTCQCSYSPGKSEAAVPSTVSSCMNDKNDNIARRVSDYSLVVGSPGKVVKQLPEVMGKQLEASAAHYVENAQKFKRSLTPKSPE